MLLSIPCRDAAYDREDDSGDRGSGTSQQQRELTGAAKHDENIKELAGRDRTTQKVPCCCDGICGASYDSLA
jgi:hypothetical protein